MRRSLFVLAGVLLALGVALAVTLLLDRDEAEPDAGGGRWADVEVTSDPGRGPARSATLRCDGEGDSAACEALAGVDRQAWGPVPTGRACTQQFGGPEQVTVTGRLGDESLDAHFTRTDGCEIARYARIEPLLEALELS